MERVRLEDATRTVALILKSFLEAYTKQDQFNNWLEICKLAEEVIEPEYKKVVDDIEDRLLAAEEELDNDEELEETRDAAKELSNSCIAEISKLKMKLQNLSNTGVAKLPDEIDHLLDACDEALENTARKASELWG